MTAQARADQREPAAEQRGPAVEQVGSAAAGEAYRFETLTTGMVLQDMRYRHDDLGPGDRVPEFNLSPSTVVGSKAPNLGRSRS